MVKVFFPLNSDHFISATRNMGQGARLLGQFLSILILVHAVGVAGITPWPLFDPTSISPNTPTPEFPF